MTLFPVIMPIAEVKHKLSGRERVARLSSIAREALRISAEKSGVILGELRKDKDDVPCPFDGHHWSLSHKPRCVAGIVSKDSIGIDIEEIRPRNRFAFRLVASNEEWILGDNRSWHTFFRYWTAKEAVLKAVGVGITGLKSCRVVSIPDENHIILNYRERFFKVAQSYYDNHIISIVKGDNEVEWIIAEDLIYC